jgi:hypothetical protein
MCKSGFSGECITYEGMMVVGVMQREQRTCKSGVVESERRPGCHLDADWTSSILQRST